MHKIFARVGLPYPSCPYWLPFGTPDPSFAPAVGRNLGPGLPSGLGFVQKDMKDIWSN